MKSWKRRWVLLVLLLTGCPSTENGGLLSFAGIGSSKPTATPTALTYPSTNPSAVPSGTATATPKSTSSYAPVTVSGGNPTNAWFFSEPMSTLRVGAGAVVRDGMIYAFEGDGYSTIEEYRPIDRTWTARQFGSECRYFPTVGILDGLLYEAGGLDVNVPQIKLPDGLQYDFSTGAVRSIAPLPVLPGIEDARFPGISVRERSHAGGGVLKLENDEVLCVAGGEVGPVLVDGSIKTAVLKQFAMYFPLTATATRDAWIMGEDLPDPRSAMGSGVVNNRLYLMGGYGADGTVLSSMIRYDPAADSWDAQASMHKPRHSFMTAVAGGKIYAIGGIGADNSVLRDVEEYDPQANLWRTLAPMPTARAMGVAVLLTDRIYVLGGYDEQGKPLRIAEVFFP